MLRKEFSRFCKPVLKYATSPSCHYSNATKSRPGLTIRHSNKLSVCHHRQVDHTIAGRLVLDPRFSKLEHICCVFLGVAVPFILQLLGEFGIYHVGDC